MEGGTKYIRDGRVDNDSSMVCFLEVGSRQLRDVERLVTSPNSLEQGIAKRTRRGKMETVYYRLCRGGR